MHNVPIDDLFYELRMLLGAAKLCRLFDKYKVGNQINYFKDSAYLHTRNLYNFFAANTRNDAKVSQFTSHQFTMPIYDTWIDALHNHASHIKDSRDMPNNIINGQHLNEMIPDFAQDIERLWQEWIDHTSDVVLKKQLEDALTAAHQQSQDDYNNLERMLVSK